MNRLPQVDCPKCLGNKTQSNTSTHNLPNGKGLCSVCGGKGTVNAFHPGYRGRKPEARSTK